MAVREARSRRGLIAGALVAMLAVPVLGGSAGAVAPRSPTGPLPQETFTLNVFGSGPIRGVVLAESGEPGRVRYALHGVPKLNQARAVWSRKACGSSHSFTDRVASVRLGGDAPSPTVARSVDHPVFSVEEARSLRILRGPGTGTQLACTKATHWTAAPATTAALIKNVSVSSFLPKPGPRGLVTVGVMADDRVKVRAELLHRDRGTFRLVGSTASCSQEHTGSAKAFSVEYNLGDTGTHEVGHFISVDLDIDQPSMAMRSIRLFKGSGLGNQVECRGIIAILIGL